MVGSTVPTVPERWARVHHPAFIGALAVLVVNDHVLKAQWSGAVTGKLSDAAGLFLLGAIGFDLADRAAGHRASQPSARIAVAVLIALPFVAVNTVPHVARAARGSARVVLDVVGNVLGRAPLVPDDGARAVLVSDPSDLLTLPAILLPLALGVRLRRPSVGADRTLPTAP